MATESPEAALHQAFSLHQAGKFTEAAKIYRAILARAPTQPEALHHLGLIEAASGRLDQADRLMTLSNQIAPGNSDWQFNLGRLAALKSDWARARSLFEGVLAKESGNVDALIALGSVLLQEGQPALARERLSAAYRWATNRPDIATTLGLAEMAEGQAVEAERLCREAVRLAPQWADAHNNLGYVLRMAGRASEAEVACRQAIALQPEHAEALINLGTLALNRRASDEARSYFERALRSQPGHKDARFGLAEALIDDGQLAEGRAILTDLIRNNPRNWRARWLDLVCFPLVYEDWRQRDAERQRFSETLERMVRDVETYLADDLSAIVSAVSSSTDFYLHYTGGDVRALQEHYGSLIARIAERAYPQHSQKIPLVTSRDRPIRVGFASSLLYRHSVMKSHECWIAGLPHERFEVIVFRLGGLVDSVTEEIGGIARLIDCSAMTQAQLIERIATEKLDVLIWLDIGMDGKVQIPAALRLAPVQATGFGHPVTSGLRSIDTYLTGDLMEPRGGEAHYTERLVRLPNLSVSYRRPEPELGEVPETIRRLKEEGRTIYLCAQSLFKLLPDQDDLIARIAARVPNSVFVFIAHGSDLATGVLRRRLGQRLAADGIVEDGRIVFLPRLTEAAFRTVNKAATVVLDSMEWSGFNSTIEALAVVTPVVAMPGATMRADHSHGILRMAGLDELIAPDTGGYVDLAVQLGTNHEFRVHMSRAIAERCGRIFDDPAPVAALADWIEHMVRSPH